MHILIEPEALSSTIHARKLARRRYENYYLAIRLPHPAANVSGIVHSVCLECTELLSNIIESLQGFYSAMKIFVTLSELLDTSQCGRLGNYFSIFNGLSQQCSI